MHENNYPLITHSCDSRFVTLRFLQTPQGRSRTGLYLIEGIRHLARTVQDGARIQSVFLDPSILSNAFGRKLARRLRQRGVPEVRLSPRLYRDLTLAGEPQGIGAVLPQQWIPLGRIRNEPNSLWLALESVESQGNLGTIIRTAEASGVAGIFILVSNCDPFDPAAVRASMGSLFSQRLIRCSPREFEIWERSDGVAIVASSPAGRLDYKASRYQFPSALLIGSEKRGLSDQLMEAADMSVRIPVCGGCDSVNAAVAAGVVLFEMASQRPTI